MKTVWVLYCDYDYEGCGNPLEVFSRPPSLEKLTKAIKEHGYGPDHTARALLASKRTHGAYTDYSYDIWRMDKFNVI